jgi:uncharacterized protein YecE (DUF72 family)
MHMPCVEVDSSNYAIPPVDRVTKWVQLTPKEFIFTFKAFQMFTMQQVDDINKLPAVIKSKLPSTMLALPSPVPIQWAHLSADAQSSLWQAFNDSIMPAYVEHKLGPVLFQFPTHFKPAAASCQWIEYCQRQLLPGSVMAVEFRCAEWLDDLHLEETVTWLQGLNIILVGVDETIRLSVEFKKQQRQVAAAVSGGFKPASQMSDGIQDSQSASQAKIPGAKVVTEYKYLDGTRAPQRLPRIALAKTHRNLMYIRVHRREGLDRMLTDEEIDNWAKLLTKFTDDNQPKFKADLSQGERFVIYFLWNTNQDDQSIRNAKNLTAKLSTTAGGKIEVFDWVGEVIEKEKKFGGISYYFAKKKPGLDDSNTNAASPQVASGSNSATPVEAVEAKEAHIKIEKIDAKEENSTNSKKRKIDKVVKESPTKKKQKTTPKVEADRKQPNIAAFFSKE